MLNRLIRTVALAAVIAFPIFGFADPILSAGSATVNVGDTFTIPISVFGATDLMAFQFDLSYDSTTLSVLSFTDTLTDFATAGGGPLFTGFPFPGLLSGVSDSLVFPGVGLSGDGVLALITFKALAPGISPLNFSNALLDFSNTPFTFVNGQVCVNGAKACPETGRVPEPGTLALLGLGWGMLRLRRRVAERAVLNNAHQ